MRVSVIIPSYNRCDLLQDAITSCKDQKDVDVEIIVVDDGSTDETASLTSSNPNIKFFQQNHQGACAARNLGLKNATGDYIKFLDSDDRLAPGILKKQVEALHSSSASAVYGDFEMIGKLDDPRVGNQPIRITGAQNDFVAALLSYWWCAPFCYLFRKETLDGLRWNENLSCLQDFDYILRFALRGNSLTYAPGICGYYRMHEGQITNSDRMKYADNRLTILDKTSKKLLCMGRIPPERAAWLSEGYWCIARTFYRHEDLRFDAIVARVYEIHPTFIPHRINPWIVRWATELLGIKRAEIFLGFLRKFKNVI